MVRINHCVSSVLHKVLSINQVKILARETCSCHVLDQRRESFQLRVTSNRVRPHQGRCDQPLPGDPEEPFGLLEGQGCRGEQLCRQGRVDPIKSAATLPPTRHESLLPQTVCQESTRRFRGIPATAHRNGPEASIPGKLCSCC